MGGNLTICCGSEDEKNNERMEIASKKLTSDSLTPQGRSDIMN
jgi:hypothetical protein